MTTRTVYPLACPCGHVGKIIMRENDQPYSKPWESFALEGLNGSGYAVEGFAKFDEVFTHMKPSCPACGAALTTAHLVR
jgi:hypothetical protein